MGGCSEKQGICGQGARPSRGERTINSKALKEWDIEGGSGEGDGKEIRGGV